MSKEDKIYMAKLAEQAERYDDMVKHMKDVVGVIHTKIVFQLGGDLSNDDRNLLSVAYKNWIGTRRSAWRAVSAIEQKEEAKGSKYLELLRLYKGKIENEVENICNDVADLLDKKLIPKANNDESQVFYLKMKADYFRYFAECTTGDKNKKAGEVADEAYKKATEKVTQLPTTHAIRLGLALNYSVFLYEIKNSPQEACKLAKTTFDGAISDLEHLEDEQYKESASIMQLLRDNLTLWTSETEEEEGGAKEKEEDL